MAILADAGLTLQSGTELYFHCALYAALLTVLLIIYLKLEWLLLTVAVTLKVTRFQQKKAQGNHQSKVFHKVKGYTYKVYIAQ